MAFLFKIQDEQDNEVEFDQTEATDTGTVKPFYTLEIGDAKSVNGNIIQQIRPGKRFTKKYQMVLEEAKYLSLLNLLTNNSNNYYIIYETAPSVLDNDPNLDELQKNNFKIAIVLGDVRVTAGNTLVYVFELTINRVGLV